MQKCKAVTVIKFSVKRTLMGLFLQLCNCRWLLKGMFKGGGRGIPIQNTLLYYLCEEWVNNMLIVMLP